MQNKKEKFQVNFARNLRYNTFFYQFMYMKKQNRRIRELTNGHRRRKQQEVAQVDQEQ